jgi:hypothetical protein
MSTRIHIQQYPSPFRISAIFSPVERFPTNANNALGACGPKEETQRRGEDR